MPSAPGCGAGTHCLPRPSGSFVGGLCISNPSDIPCPAGPFTARHVFYGGFTEGRGCSACTCGAASGMSCSTTITIYSMIPPPTTTCSGVVTTFNVDSTNGGCVNLQNNPAVAGRTATAPAITGGMCPASGGTPTGTAMPTAAVTFCCIP
jgi:hypothetical protein